MNYTNKEISIRLKELGFDVGSRMGHMISSDGIVQEGMIVEHIDFTVKWECDGFTFLPAYTSDQLFEWLRNETENYSRPMNDIFISFNRIIITKRIYKTFKAEFKTTLADMLASAIIWILKEESK